MQKATLLLAFIYVLGSLTLGYRSVHGVMVARITIGVEAALLADAARLRLALDLSVIP